MPSGKFPKSQRLKSGEVQRVFQNGKRVKGPYFSVIFMRDDDAGQSDLKKAATIVCRKMAAVVGKKIFKKAVDRNRYKRWMREAFRCFSSSEILPGCYVFILTQVLPECSAQKVANEMAALVKRISRP